jgi:DNA-binding transcriptional ArsR family regulator
MRRCAYVDAGAMDDVTRLQAEVLKVLANPTRLEIIHRLADGPLEVGRLARAIGTTQPGASQHLAVLRSSGLVEPQRHGREIRYRLTDPDVIVACGLMRGVLLRRIGHLADLAGSHALASLGPAPAAGLMRSPA